MKASNKESPPWPAAMKNPTSNDIAPGDGTSGNFTISTTAPASVIAAPIYRVRKWQGVTDKSPGQELILDAPGLRALYEGSVASSKNALPLIKMGSMSFVPQAGGGHKKLLATIWGIEGDYDAGEVSPEQASSRLAAHGVESVIYETASSTGAPGGYRWRVLAPASNEMHESARHELASKLNGALGGILSAESFVSTQSFFLGHTNQSRSFHHNAGTPIDQCSGITPQEPTPSLGTRDKGSRGTMTIAEWVDDLEHLERTGELPYKTTKTRWEVIEDAKTGRGDVHLGVVALSLELAINETDHRLVDVILDGFVAAVAATRGEHRAQDVLSGEWERAYNGALRKVESWKTQNESKDAEEAANILIPFKFSEALTAPETVVNGFLPAEGVGVLWGDPGSFKSFIALDLALCVATGRDWHGLQVKQGRTWLLAGEGHAGTERRVRAWRHANCPELSDLSDLSDQFFHTPRALLISESDGTATNQVRELVKTIEAGNVPSVVVVDTLARAMSGDENTSRDMGAFIRALETLVNACRLAGQPVCVILVHHSRKDGGVYRGSSSLRGAADFEFEVQRSAPGGTKGFNCDIECHKMKDFRQPEPKKFVAEEVVLGTVIDNWGIETSVTSLVMRSDEGQIKAMAQSAAMDTWESYRRAIEEGHGKSQSALGKAVGADFSNKKRGGTRTLQQFVDWGWLTESKVGISMSYTLGPNVPM